MSRVFSKGQKNDNFFKQYYWKPVARSLTENVGKAPDMGRKLQKG
jgi:hypothetical protein